MNANRSPIVVIGAGIVGVSAALWLQRDGHNVVLIDKNEPGEGTSYGNGGVLASCSIVPVTVPGLLAKAPRMLFDPNQPLFLKWSYLPKLLPWLGSYLSHCTPQESRRIASALNEIVGDSLADHLALSKGTKADKWIVPCDYLYIYRNRSHYEGDAFEWGIRRDNGFKWQEMEGRAFQNYDPVFSEDCGFAACLSNHGRIADPGQYVKDLAAHFMEQGGRLIRAKATDIVRENDQITGVRCGGETVACSHAVLATGVWSGPLAKAFGVKVPLESERGYHLELWGPDRMPRSPVMITSGKFVMTPMEGRLRLAGIVEFGGLDKPASRAPFALLKRNVEAALPGITWKETREWMGHRPAPADSIPVIGPAPDTSNAYFAFGHHHIGLTGGPKTGRMIADMIAGRRANFDLAPYAPARFV